MTPTIHGAELDLLVIREVRDRILAGDWTQGVFTRGRCRCLTGWLMTHGEPVGGPLYNLILNTTAENRQPLCTWNDTHTQAEVVALLDDVEDSLLGELGVEG